MTNIPEVAVIIITYNSASEIEECISSIYSEKRDTSQHVVVLDNCSSDNTVEIVRENFPDVSLITPSKNLGFAKGVNKAIKESSSEYILLLNPDTKIVDSAIDNIVDFARENPNHGIYGGRTLTPEGELEPSSCWGLPTLWSTAMFASGISTILKQNPIFDPESLGTWKRDTVREVGVITGCFLLSKRKFWENDLQGFDERFFMYGEDQDLAMRVHSLGLRPVICPKATLVHEVGKSSKTPTHKMMLLYKGKACLFRTHWSGIKQKLGLAMLLAGVALRAFPSWIRSIGKRNYEPERYLFLWQNRQNWIAGYPPLT